MVSAPVLSSPARASDDVAVYGFVSPGSERVRHAFVENFTRRHELGGACCAYYRAVRQLLAQWSLCRSARTRASTTRRVCRSRATRVSARSPASAITLGFYQGELLRRIDPQHRTLGRFVQDEIATPLGIDLYIRLPEAIPNRSWPPWLAPRGGSCSQAFPGGWRSTSSIHIRTSSAPSTAPCLAHDAARIYARDLEIPSGGGVGTARGMARAYSAFATGGELGLTGQTLRLLAAPAWPPDHGFYDECMKDEARFSLGFMKPGNTWRFGSSASFGSPGAGGAMGFADPTFGIGYGYVTSRGGTSLIGDPRDVALSEALYASIDG